MRQADGLYFLGINGDSTVLLVGERQSYTADALSRICKSVLVFEPNRQYADNQFDAIIIEESVLDETLVRSLKSGGEIYIAVQKRKSFRFARNFVLRAGLQDVNCFIVLPGHRTPMFFLPLQNIGAMHYFFRNLFYLVATVPPEKRGKYKFVIGMASVAAKLFPVHFLVFLLRITFLSKIIIARKVS